MILSLLLVEDDPLEARRLESVLTRLGYAVTHAGDGDGALARLSDTAFDVVLLDLVLPELDGRGVMAAMAARGIATPVVVQATPAGLDAAPGALRAGARDFVVKPAGALRLEVALANAVALHRASRGQPQDYSQQDYSQQDHSQQDHPRDLDPPPRRGPAQDNVISLPAAPASAGAAYARLDASGHARRLEQIEAEAIRFACHLYGGRLTEVARRLGIGRSTLYRKLAVLEDGTVEGNRAVEPIGRRVVAAE